MSEDFLNTGDQAWQLTSATLVGMQTMVGLVMIYGGLVKKKWAINSAFMVMYAFAAVLLVWSVCAYRASFGKYLIPFWGRPGKMRRATFRRRLKRCPFVILFAVEDDLSRSE
jgi:Amt family ammonium transporter